jgi:hypothetical protein
MQSTQRPPWPQLRLAILGAGDGGVDLGGAAACPASSPGNI